MKYSDEERLELSEGAEEWASYAWIDEDGCKLSELNDICYGQLFTTVSQHSTDVVLFVAKKYWTQDIARWISWVVQDSFFKDIFVDKDLDFIEQYGVRIDLNQDRAKLLVGMQLFRMGIENGHSWSWCDAVDMGFNPDEAFAFACNFSKRGYNEYSIRLGLTEHMAVCPCQRLGRYSFDSYKPSEEVGVGPISSCLINNYQNSPKCFKDRVELFIDFVETIGKYQAKLSGKELVTKTLQALKGA